VLRRLLLVALGSLALAAPASAFTKQEASIPMSDGATIAATVTTPDRAAPSGGFPAVILLHGLGGKRADMERLAAQMRLSGEDYVVLTFDARGHGQSGGLVGIDGPREIADTRAVFDWLAARPDVADKEIGGWGISYGGGAIWNSLAAGTPWAAVEVAESWTDLYSALAPQGLAKSGVIALFLQEIQARVEPEVLSVRDAAYAGGDLSAIRPFTTARSSIARLDGVRVPTFLMQGRRDFAFGLDQAYRAYAKLKGPKRLWIGNHGHAPSMFPAADTARMLTAGKAWFDLYLRGIAPKGAAPPPVVIANEGQATTRAFQTIPKALVSTVGGAVAPRTIKPSGKYVSRSKLAVRRLGPSHSDATEVFGSPVARVTVTATAGWTRLVAVLSARTRAGKEIVISAGGVPTRPGTRSYAIRMIDQATIAPEGSTLLLTLASNSLAQNPANLLYLDLPMAASARLTIRRVQLSVPILA
jgi:pimeloyl-ACP methyl ester carboxylesterase